MSKTIEEVMKRASTVVHLSAAEKLALRCLENEYLKANLRMQQLKAEFENLNKSAEEIQQKFKNSVEYLSRQYLADAKIDASHVFDAAALFFKKAV